MSDVLIYLRRSVADDDNPGAVSYGQQVARCRELAALHGTSDPEVLVDWGRSGGEGKEHKRTSCQMLRDRIAVGGVRWVVSYDLSRLSRSTRETLDLVEHARSHGASVHVGDLGILDPDDPTGKFTVTALAGANTLLRDMASKRAKEQTAARQAKGLPIGRPPYGAREGEDVAAVVAAYRDGGSYHEGARILNARGVATRTGAPWSGHTVHTVVVRAIGRSTTARPRVRSRGRYILTGLVRCDCGQAMRAIGTRYGPVVICGRGISDATHTRPIQASESKLLPWIRAEAARLQVPSAVEVAGDDARRDVLAAKRDRYVELFATRRIDLVTFDAKVAPIDDELVRLPLPDRIVEVPGIDWDEDEPGDLNLVLRAMWERVELDAEMRPIRAIWWDPRLRAD